MTEDYRGGGGEGKFDGVVIVVIVNRTFDAYPGVLVTTKIKRKEW